MLDPKLVRENAEAVKEATRVKRVASPELVDEWLAADGKRRGAQTAADNLRSEQKKISERVGVLKRELKGGSNPEVEKLVGESNALKQKMAGLAEMQAAAEGEAQQIMLQLPAIPDPSWPVGKDAEENKVVREWADAAIGPRKLS